MHEIVEDNDAREEVFENFDRYMKDVAEQRASDRQAAEAQEIASGERERNLATAAHLEAQRQGFADEWAADEAAFPAPVSQRTFFEHGIFLDEESFARQWHRAE